jgi:RNA polymerase sigma-70 factor, ECF subfamily
MLSSNPTPQAPRYAPRVVSDTTTHYYHGDSTSRGTRYVQPVAGTQVSDNELALIRAVSNADRQAFERLYYLYAPRLARYLGKFLRSTHAVEEAINDVMLVVWQSAARFDANASRLSTWIFGIAHNKALKAMARAGRHAAEVSYDVDDAPQLSDESFARDAFSHAAPNNPERETFGKQLGELLAWALDQLSAEHRGVIELAFAEDCSYEEIATIMQCPTNTVKTRVFHARKKLALLLASRGVDHTVDLRG